MHRDFRGAGKTYTNICPQNTISGDVFLVSSSHYLHLAASEMWCWSGGREITKLFVLQHYVPLSWCCRSTCKNCSYHCAPMVHNGTSSSYRSIDCIGLWSWFVPRVQTQRYGSRSFRVSGPTVWNSLPQNLRSSDISREQFKRGPKTWLFERAYV